MFVDIDSTSIELNDKNVAIRCIDPTNSDAASLELTEEDVASMNIANNSINEIKQGPGYKKSLEGFDKLST